MSDSSTNDDDVDDLVDNVGPNGNVDKSPSEVRYEKCDHSFMTLVLLSRGLDDSSVKAVLDLNTDPWTSLTLETNKTMNGSQTHKRWKNTSSKRRWISAQKDSPERLFLSSDEIWQLFIPDCVNSEQILESWFSTLERDRESLLSPVASIVEWLDEHQITPPTDVAFLVAKVLSEKLLVERLSRTKNRRMNYNKDRGPGSILIYGLSTP